MNSYDTLSNILASSYNIFYALASQLGLAQLFDNFPDIEKIKLISFILSVVFGILFWLMVVKINKLSGQVKKTAAGMLTPSSPSRGGVAAKWEEILRHINSPKEVEWKFAVIESDKLTDEILKSAGYHGESMGERLINIDKSQMESLGGLWEAHKLRNRIVHEIDYYMRYSEAKRAVDLYGEALKELGVI